jgi:hypothetical protein
MAMIKCRECGREMSDMAAACPQCGAPTAPTVGYEYRSSAAIGDLPLLHVAVGIDPATGRKRIARGVVAIGDIAVGCLAIGGVSLGAVSLGGLAIGGVSLGGAAIAAGVAIGGAALGTVAIGGAAVGYYACGGGAFGAHTVSGLGTDPEAVAFFSKWFGWALPPGLRSRP